MKFLNIQITCKNQHNSLTFLPQKQTYCVGRSDCLYSHLHLGLDINDTGSTTDKHMINKYGLPKDWVQPIIDKLVLWGEYINQTKLITKYSRKLKMIFKNDFQDIKWKKQPHDPQETTT